MNPNTADEAKKAVTGARAFLGEAASGVRGALSPVAAPVGGAIKQYGVRGLGTALGAADIYNAATDPNVDPKTGYIRTTAGRVGDALTGAITAGGVNAPNPALKALGWAAPLATAGLANLTEAGYFALNPLPQNFPPQQPPSAGARPAQQAPVPTPTPRPQATSTGSRVSAGDSALAAPRLQTPQIPIPKAPEAAISQEAAARLAMQAAQGGMWAAPVAGAIAGVGQREATRVFKQDMTRRQLEQQGIDSANRDALSLYGDQARVAAARYGATKDLAQQQNITALTAAYADARLRGDNAKAGVYSGLLRTLTGNAPEQYSYIKPELGDTGKGSLLDITSGRVIPLQNTQPGIYAQPDGSTLVIDQQGRQATYAAGTKVPGFANGGLIDVEDDDYAPMQQQAIPVAGRVLDGPGTETSDSLPAVIDGTQPAALSKGEYVIPADVVRAKGTEFFDKLLAGVRSKGQPEGKAAYAAGGAVVPPAPQNVAFPVTMRGMQPPSMPMWRPALDELSRALYSGGADQTERSPIATIGIRG